MSFVTQIHFGSLCLHKHHRTLVDCICVFAISIRRCSWYGMTLSKMVVQEVDHLIVGTKRWTNMINQPVHAPIHSQLLMTERQIDQNFDWNIHWCNMFNVLYYVQPKMIRFPYPLFQSAPWSGDWTMRCISNGHNAPVWNMRAREHIIQL